MASWYDAITPGEWGVVAGGTLTASGVDQSSGQVIDQYSTLVVNDQGIYNGSTFISGTFLCFFGGGHAVYGGNEVYAFGPLQNDTPAWYRLRDATSPAPQNVSEDANGMPVSRHTYSALVYIGGARNWLFSAGILARYTDAGGGPETHTFQFNTASPNTNNPWTKRVNMPIGGAEVAAYDPTTGYVWANAANAVQRIDIAANTAISSIYKSPNWGTTGSASAIDTGRGLWFMLGGVALQGYRLNNGVGNDYYNVSVTGTAPAPASGYKSLLWDPVDDRFVSWSGSGKQIFFLTPPASNPYQGGNNWTWSSSTPSGGSTPSSENAQGTFTRFAYVGSSGIRGYVLVNRAGDSVYFYRPTTAVNLPVGAAAGTGAATATGVAAGVGGGAATTRAPPPRRANPRPLPPAPQLVQVQLRLQGSPRPLPRARRRAAALLQQQAWPRASARALQLVQVQLPRRVDPWPVLRARRRARAPRRPQAWPRASARARRRAVARPPRRAGPWRAARAHRRVPARRPLSRRARPRTALQLAQALRLRWAGLSRWPPVPRRAAALLRRRAGPWPRLQALQLVQAQLRRRGSLRPSPPARRRAPARPAPNRIRPSAARTCWATCCRSGCGTAMPRRR